MQGSRPLESRGLSKEPSVHAGIGQSKSVMVIIQLPSMSSRSCGPRVLIYSGCLQSPVSPQCVVLLQPEAAPQHQSLRP